MEKQVKEVLNKIRPIMQQDGGDIEFVELDEKQGIVKVRLTGACAGCPMADITLKHVVEAALQEEVPEIKQVVLIQNENHN
ncbi:MAG: NifU family protein [Patescibacteria group bacterium]